MANVKVALRVRPLTTKETLHHQTAQINNNAVLQVEGNVVKLKSPWADDAGDFHQLNVRQFTFDYCHWSADPHHIHYASQQTVFDDIGTQVLDALFNGYNACVLAYGQSGTGKTYTMIGTESEPGITPRLCTAIFNQINHGDTPQSSFRVHVSFMEIYNEKVRDLLESASTRHGRQLRVREHPKFGPYVQDLSRHAVFDADSCLNLLSIGMKRRTSAPNAHQRHSSRSHAVFTIHFAAAQISGHLPRETSAKVHLVDLAGSERAGRDLSRVRLKEGATINKSLATLGNVINALAERSSLLSTSSTLRSSSSTFNLSSPSVALSLAAKSTNSVHNTPSASPRRVRVPFIPYRNSVLTWLLKDSLGGNSRTFMIAAVSPSALAYKETLSTLRFAQRAQHVVNVPVVNEEAAPKLIRHLKEELARLRAVLSDSTARAVTDTVNSARPETLVQLMTINEARSRELTEDWLLRWRNEPDESTVSEHVCRVVVECSDVGVQTSLPWLINDQVEETQHSVGSTSVSEIDEDNSTDLIPVKEVSNEFWFLDDDDSTEMMMLRAFDRAEEAPVPPLRTNPQESEADWSEDSLDASNLLENRDVETDSLDDEPQISSFRRLERSPTPPKNHRRIHARKPNKPKPHVRTIFDETHSPPFPSDDCGSSTETERGSLDRSIAEGERLVAKLSSLVDRLSIIDQPSVESIPSFTCSHGTGRPKCISHHFCCRHQPPPVPKCHCVVHHCHARHHPDYECLWELRRRLLYIRRQMVARTASDQVRRHLAYLQNAHDVLPDEKWV